MYHILQLATMPIIMSNASWEATENEYRYILLRYLHKRKVVIRQLLKAKISTVDICDISDNVLRFDAAYYEELTNMMRDLEMQFQHHVTNFNF